MTLQTMTGILAACVALTAGAAQGMELVLTEKGASLAPIVLFKDAPPATRLAAGELAAYIEKISGARPAVIEGDPAPTPQHAIWVGVQPRLNDLFPTIDFDFKHPEEILIAASANHLVIAGRDRWNPARMEIKRGKYGVNDYGQQEYGTANAVYTFLQDRLGVRWLWQGETGEDIIRKERIAFEPFEYRYHPRVQMRRHVMWWWARPEQRGKLSADWGRLQRLTLDSSNLRGDPDGHAFGDWWERFHKTHPEYFALQPDGSRGYHPELGPRTVKLCKSNPAVWDQWLDDVAQQIEADPGQTLFRGAVNDGNLSGYCVCERCKAWDAPDAEKRFLVWGGHSETYVAMSDRQTRFANELARKLLARYPGRDYRVMMLAYGPSNPAPVRNKPDSNVIVIHCTNWFDDVNDKDPRSLIGKTWAQEYAEWAATGADLWWRPNIANKAGLYQGMPDVPFGRVIQSFQHAVKHNGSGVAPACFWNFWPTQGPLYYLLAQLAWNPDQDGYAVLDDYYQRGFGKAAGQIKAYWTLMEQNRNRKVDENLDFWKAYDEGFFARATALLDEAAAALAAEPPVYSRRVAHVRLGLDHTRMMVAAYELKDRYKAGQEPQVAGSLRQILAALKSRTRGDTAYYMGPAFHLDRWLSEPRELWEPGTK